MSVPQVEIGGSGPPLHFSHANGYPPLTYRALLEPLSASHNVSASLHRPLWKTEPREMRSWHDLGRDLEALLSRRQEPVLGVGHSMGAAALVMAAARQPRLFRGLVLIEPVLVPPLYTGLLRVLRPLARRRVPLIRRTLERTEQWRDRRAVFEHFRGKRVFARISDEVLWDYVEHGTRAIAGGRRLCYDREWEAHCYLRIANLWTLLPALQVPVLGIRGADSDTLAPAQWTRWQRISPEHDYLEIAGAGHLLPFEAPSHLAEIIGDWAAAKPHAAG